MLDISPVAPVSLPPMHATKPLSLRGARELVGLSQQAFAARVGISQQHYSDLECGRAFLKPAELLALLWALRTAGLHGLTVSDLACTVAVPAEAPTRSQDPTGGGEAA